MEFMSGKREKYSSTEEGMCFHFNTIKVNWIKLLLIKDKKYNLCLIDSCILEMAGRAGNPVACGYVIKATTKRNMNEYECNNCENLGQAL